MKTHTTLTIDAELLERAKSLGINISGAFNEYLAGYIQQQTQDVAGINIELEKIKRNKITAKITTLQSELKVCEKNIEVWNLAKEKEEEQRLQEEKERIDLVNRCSNCHNVFGEDYKGWNTFPIGKICKSCFLGASKENFIKWNQTQ